ncbi:MAG: hypothetical protein M3O09_05700 [Acidobacteriota bacterium]|nr:hypothetical protein [Acidobacteriota bacterium]
MDATQSRVAHQPLISRRAEDSEATITTRPIHPLRSLHGMVLGSKDFCRRLNFGTYGIGFV